jgi:two-component system chemotaxis sensor kinase CheA
MASSAQDRKIRRLFLEEASEHVQAMNDHLLELEASPAEGQEALAALLRAAHTVKGTAGAAGLSRIEALVHNWESCLEQLSGGRVAIDENSIGLMYRCLDQIEAAIQEDCTGMVGVPESPAPTLAQLREVFGKDIQLVSPVAPNDTPQEEAAPIAGVDDGTSIRVSTQKVENLMTGVEDLVQMKAGGAARERDFRKLEVTVFELGRGLERFRSLLRELNGQGAHFMATIDELKRKHEEVERLSGLLSQDLRHHTHVFNGLAERLQDDIRAVRMVPVEEAFATFPRAVRDVARRLEKIVVLNIEGGSTEIDRDLVDLLKNPMLHLLRNSVSHGIEFSDVRSRLGKQAEGHITIRAEGRAGGLQLTISDDGKGLDPELIRETAIRKGLVGAEEAQSMQPNELNQLIFLPGFSTATTVDSVSGRGVGLDVVRETVERCSGTVFLESSPGMGTKFTLRLPLNLTSMRMLILRVGSELYAVPVGSVERVLRVSAQDLKQVDDGLACEVSGRPVAVDRLARLMGAQSQETSAERSPAIVLRSGPHRAALLVDAIEGEQELIVKSLGSHLIRVPNISGATVQANGRIVPLLHVPDVVRSLAAKRNRGGLFAERSGQKTNRHRVLVADDSITTRTLEKSILEAAGYHVEVATDGVDALSKLNQGEFHLVISDFQMPRMDGLELVARIKADERHREIPVVLVSSLASADDRARGLRAGADAYLGKGEFTQELLLQTLERLL